LRGIPLRLESPRPDRALQPTAPDSTCREQSALFQRRTILAPIWRRRCISCTLRYHVNQAVPGRTCSHRVTRWPPLTRKSPPLSASLLPPLPLRCSKKCTRITTFPTAAENRASTSSLCFFAAASSRRSCRCRRRQQRPAAQELKLALSNPSKLTVQ
jgi:hypothetical protein